MKQNKMKDFWKVNLAIGGLLIVLSFGLMMGSADKATYVALIAVGLSNIAIGATNRQKSIEKKDK